MFNGTVKCSFSLSFSLSLPFPYSLDLFLDLFFCSLSSILAEADAFRPFPILWPIHKDLNSTLVLGLSCPSSAKWTAIWKIAESLLWLDPLRDPILFDTMPSRFRRCPLRRWTSSCRLASFEIPNLFLNRIFRYEMIIIADSRMFVDERRRRRRRKKNFRRDHLLTRWCIFHGDQAWLMTSRHVFDR